MLRHPHETAFVCLGGLQSKKTDISYLYRGTMGNVPVACSQKNGYLLRFFLVILVDCWYILNTNIKLCRI